MIFDFQGERQRVAHQMSDALVFVWPAMPATLASHSVEGSSLL